MEVYVEKKTQPKSFNDLKVGQAYTLSDPEKADVVFIKVNDSSRLNMATGTIERPMNIHGLYPVNINKIHISRA